MKYLVNRETKEHRLFAGTDPLHGTWSIVEADSEGWIPWSSKSAECPLPIGAKVEVKFLRGKRKQQIASNQLAGHWVWDDPTLNAYRPILTEQSEPEYPFNDKSLWEPVRDIGTAGNVFDRLSSAVRASQETPSIIEEIDAMLKPAGFCVARIPQEEPAPQSVEDMSDWRNWREGDIIERVAVGASWWTVGRSYITVMYDNMLGVRDNTDDFMGISDKTADRFRFISRPTGASK